MDRGAPLGMLCMHPPDEAVTLLYAAKIGIDSLFVDVPESAKKFGDYLQHIDQTRPCYVYNNKGLGYTTFNHYSSEEYRTYGRVSSPECRCDERLKTKTKEFTRLTYTGWFGGMEHLKIETRSMNEKIANALCEYVT